MASKDFRIYVVEDNSSVRRSLCALMTAHGYDPSPFASAEDFLEGYDPDMPACMLLDIKMPGISGLQLQELLNNQGVAIPIVVLTGHGDVAAAVQAMKNGAIDFVEKPPDERVLLAAIKAAVERLGNKPLARIPQAEVKRRLARLTTREREVLDHLVQGKINKQIADDLGISQRTVEVHRARIREKMEARGLADLIRLFN
ncbi:MAG: response regulator [Pseudomonadota bacterium]